ncbi:MAG TPA: NrfD/PsrC family molybdoenzyme membrane anchor subunit [Anaerolineales bacterium]|nr:NrfD/PsrC family molybdoenzyme membrane anchor subunit [Anaerolineales bacterium]
MKKNKQNLRSLLTLIKPTPWTIWLGFLGLVMLTALGGAILVFWNGLWITHLTDLVPWGLWITIDLSSVALSAGAFSLCAAVYLIGLKRYEPIARTATFIGLVGYSMAMMALLLDIGRPDRFWHSMVFWNDHSLLWEVTMCVCLYLTVLLFESMPILANWNWLKKNFPKVTAIMSHVHHYAPYLAVAGLCLSMLHQSSLGAVYGVLSAHPFWYKPEMSVLFIFSAVIGGISLTLFASMIASRLTPRAKVNDVLIERVAYFVAWALVGYLYFRFWDVWSQNYTYEPGRTEGLRLIISGTLSFNFWVGEMILGTVLPMILLLTPDTRKHPFWRTLALGLVVSGVVAFRWDTNLAGLMVVISYLPGPASISYTSYTPSLIEFITGSGVIAYGLLAFSLGVRYLQVVDHRLASGVHETVEVETLERVPA